MPEFPWQIKESIEKLREVDMQDNYLLTRRPLQHSIRQVHRSVLVIEALASLESSLVALLCSSGKTVPEVGSLITMGPIRPQNNII